MNTNTTPTPAQLLAHEKRYLIHEIHHQLDYVGHLFSVSLNHPIDDDDKEALIYLAWEKAEYSKTLLNQLKQLINEPTHHHGNNKQDDGGAV